MKLFIEIDLEGAPFKGREGEGEIRDCLEIIADMIGEYGVSSIYRLGGRDVQDVNGNVCGYWEIRE